MKVTDADRPVRRAVIQRRAREGGLGGIPTPETVGRYLPSNYRVVRVTAGEIVIEGRDNAGWTMDGYVIPRLQSGMIFPREVLSCTTCGGALERSNQYPDAGFLHVRDADDTHVPTMAASQDG